MALMALNKKMHSSIDYMRISITEQCNLRCRFCMSDVEASEFEEMPMLAYKEMLRIVKAAVSLGITKYKITGGEPLVRAGVPEFVKALKQLEGVEKVTLTTNGVLLTKYIKDLKNSGIDGINISISSLDPNVNTYVTRRECLNKTLEGLQASIDAGIPTKINCVPIKAINALGLIDLAELAKRYPVDVRFIEMMPIGLGADYEHYPSAEIISILEGFFGLAQRSYEVKGNGPAIYYNFEGFNGSIGFISAISHSFCEECNRLRLTANGDLKPCLCYDSGINLMDALRETGSDKALKLVLKEVIDNKPRFQSFNQCIETLQSEKRKMAQIGG